MGHDALLTLSAEQQTAVAQTLGKFGFHLAATTLEQAGSSGGRPEEGP